MMIGTRSLAIRRPVDDAVCHAVVAVTMSIRRCIASGANPSPYEASSQVYLFVGIQIVLDSKNNLRVAKIQSPKSWILGLQISM